MDPEFWFPTCAESHRGARRADLLHSFRLILGWRYAHPTASWRRSGCLCPFCVSPSISRAFFFFLCVRSGCVQGRMPSRRRAWGGGRSVGAVLDACTMTSQGVKDRDSPTPFSLFCSYRPQPHFVKSDNLHTAPQERKMRRCIARTIRVDEVLFPGVVPSPCRQRQAG